MLAVLEQPVAAVDVCGILGIVAACVIRLFYFCFHCMVNSEYKTFIMSGGSDSWRTLGV